MGLYDRDYGRDERTPWDRIESRRSITATLIIINVVVFLASILFYSQQPDPISGAVSRRYYIVDWLAVHGETLLQPWMWWQYLTYGFVHDTQEIWHLLFNMFLLFVFGRDVESRMGRTEFLRFYLVAIVLGGIIGAATHAAYGLASGLPPASWGYTIGASGAVVATTILFACYFPNREILLMLVFPMKAWVLAVFLVMVDLLGAIGGLAGMGPTPLLPFIWLEPFSRSDISSCIGTCGGWTWGRSATCPQGCGIVPDA